MKNLSYGLVFLMIAPAASAAGIASHTSTHSPGDAQTAQQRIAARQRARAAAAHKRALAAQEKARAAHDKARVAQYKRQLERAQRALQTAAAQVATLSLESVGDELQQVGIGMGWARLGLNIGDPAQSGGLRVQAVTPGGAAEEAGIRAGDTLREVGGVQLGNDKRQSDLADVLGDLEPGSQVSVTWARKGETHQASLTARDLFASVTDWSFPEEAIASAMKAAHSIPRRFRFDLPNRWNEMLLARLTPELGQYFGTDSGLLVVRAPDNGELKLHDGDVILKIGAREPADPTQAMRILRSYMPGDTLTLTVMRDGERRKLEVTLKKPETFGLMQIKSKSHPGRG